MESIESRAVTNKKYDAINYLIMLLSKLSTFSNTDPVKQTEGIIKHAILKYPLYLSNEAPGKFDSF